MDDKCVYLIDATAFCYRAYYALRNLATSFGQPTNAVYGFIKMLNKILKEKKPEFMAICFDVSRDTFRQKKFSEYKIHRPPMPDGLTSQIPLIKQIIAAYGIALLEKEGYEADDVIATLSSKATSEGFSVHIVSSDKDMLQLVGEKVVVSSPHKDADLLYDRAKLYQRFGVEPQNIPDIVALMGDDADNIPGVPGVGEKTAVGLIGQFGSLENLLQGASEIRKDKIRKSVADNLEMIKLNKELAVLDRRVDLDFSPQGLKIGPPDRKELFRIFKYLEFKKLLQDLSLSEANASGDVPLMIKDEQLPGFLTSADELVLSGPLGPQGIVFYARDKLFALEEFGVNTRRALSDKKIKKVGHDLKKIKISLAKANLSLEGLHFDTMLAAYLLDPSKPGYALSDLAWDFLGEITETKSLDSARAIGLIVESRPKLEEALRERSQVSLFADLEMPLIDVLFEMEATGIRLDKFVLEELSKDVEKRLIKLIEEIYELSGCQFNINSPKQLRVVLFETLKLPVLKKSKTGPSTDEEVLRNLAPMHELPARLLEYRQLTKLKSTYIDTLPGFIDKDTGRIHASFNQTGTETGRLSSSNPNLQNIPIKTDIGSNIRRAIIALDGDSCLLACDYSQIELRILAHISQDQNLILAFKENKDIHNATASLIYGLAEADITAPLREAAKRVNFGIVYGLTPYGLSRDLGISAEAAQNFIDAYFLKYPGVKDYMQEQIRKTEKDGFAATIMGRRRYIPEINNKNQGIRQFAQRKAINTPIQGSASDLIKLAMVQIHRQIKERNFASRLILQIHDELVFNVPDREMNDFTDLVKGRMENVLELAVPLRVSVKKGKNWLEMETIR